MSWRRIALAVWTVMTLLGAPLAGAQGEAKPTVAFIRFGPYLGFQALESRIAFSLLQRGYVTVAENAMLRRGQDLEGERLNVRFYDANFDYSAVSALAEAAIDAGADVLITQSTPVTQAAVQITSDMEDPPAVIFSSVFDPYAAGIAQASCVKPAHLTGIISQARYEDIVPLLQLQNPDISALGIIFSSTEQSGVSGAAAIQAIAEAAGLRVESAGIVSVADVALAADSLVERGVEAMIIPADMGMVATLPVLMSVATEHGIPVFHSVAVTAMHGVTVHAGPADNFAAAAYIGALLDAHFSGESQIGDAAISVVDKLSVGVNLDVAEAQGIEIAKELIAMSEMVVEDGAFMDGSLRLILQALNVPEEDMSQTLKYVTQYIETGEIQEGLPPQFIRRFLEFGRQMAEAQLAEALPILRCADEMIAEQQAALDEAGA